MTDNSKQNTTESQQVTQNNTDTKPQLVDRFGRQVTYVRLSVTDRCDLRCVYCMSEDMTFVPREQLLTLEEMSRIGKAFVELGVNKIRISGGEPLTRRNILTVFESLGELDGLKDLTITTNATLLEKYAQPLKDAGVTRINVSLDTLNEARFKKITRIGKLEKTMAGIDAALKVGFQKVKLNSVIMKDYNDDEINALVEFVRERGMDISFIEEMPLGEIGDHDRAETYFSSDKILSKLQESYELTATDETTGGPAKYFRFNDSDSRIGFISPHSHNFCDDCNRVRVTAEGMLLLCLGQEHSMDLRKIVRANPNDDEALRSAIIDSMQLKPKGHDFNLNGQPIIMRHMSATGG
ncbi:GTP 3',8-cyclase MoaA [Cocleimonas sp. KMM 6892]|uniref:GTP 3',8-cyclase MoaA n=1 Tax=unclassified Cocleimonas TaxID=2639732 RepID=UPI002DBCC233|nr:MULTISPECIES: GTP 3',8-cyclase MoaA [unclassified Cocleimonas]MEB8433112.1 GTP 3',8-cyclase MoaA [Cocleimonas sp. KMM 6892]MEC4715907.1 GTP 3',8-cyclase MoaA [Cocleimonas sp. KMM 6895]MEC4745368.1 GTP 3',8-cyclase MoaA [Cocleimonas sp. KMM 6896]